MPSRSACLQSLYRMGASSEELGHGLCLVHFCFGSLADIRGRIKDVHFTPKADMLSASIDVR